MSCLCPFTDKEGERGCLSAAVLTQSKEKETSIRIETNKSLSASPSIKGHLVSPVQPPSSYFIYVFVCCVVYSCTPCAWQSAKKECVNAMKWMGEYSFIKGRVPGL